MEETLHRGGFVKTSTSYASPQLPHIHNPQRYSPKAMLLSWKNSLKIPSIGRLKSVAVMVEEFVRFRNEKTVPNKPLLLPLFLLYSSCSIQSLLKSQPRPDCMTFGLNINSLGLFPPGGLRGERVEDAVARVSCNWKDPSF